MTAIFSTPLKKLIITATVFQLLFVPHSYASMEDALSAVRKGNYELAYELFLIEANDGNAEAQYRLAGMLSTGNGIEKNIPLAVEWYQKAADLGHDKAKRKLSQVSSSVANVTDPNASLSKAARQGNIDQIKHLISNGTDINFQDNIGSTALIEATRENQNTALDFLLSQNADPNLTNNLSDTALLIAASLNNLKAVQSLLLKGANANIADRHTATPLHFAVRRENLKMTELLIKNGADIFKKDNSGKSVHDIATGTNNQVLISIIEKAGGRELAKIISNRELNSKKNALTSISENQRGWTPLMYAAWRGDLEMVKAALELSDDIDQKDENNMTALALAASGGHTQIISALQSAGAKIGCDQNDTHPLALSIKTNQIQAAQFLINALNDKSECIPLLQSMLNQALSQERYEIAGYLFQSGITIGNSGQSPLLIMASKADESLINLLITKGADVSEQNELGETALIIASKSGNLEAMKALIAHKAAIKATDRFGRTALMHSAINDQIASVALLIENGADPSRLSNENNSALMLASENGFSSIVEKLVVFGNLDQKNSIGDTSLIMAARRGHFDVADILLRNGANPRLSNNKKEKAITVVSLDQKALYDLIEKHSSSRSWIDDIF